MSCRIKDMIRDDLADWIAEGLIKTDGDKAIGPDGKTYANNINDRSIFKLHAATLDYLKEQRKLKEIK